MAENVIQIKSGIMISVGARYKKHHICEKGYICNTATCSCKIGKYLAIIVDDSVVMCDEIKDTDAEDKLCGEETKTVTTNFNEKNVICKTKKFYILLEFLLIIITLLIDVSIYCYLIKHK